MSRKGGPRPHHVKIVRYATPDGRRCRKDTPGAVRTVEQSETYYAHMPDPGGGRPLRVSLGTTDLGAAWVKLRELQKEAVLREQGLASEFAVHARCPLAEHVGRWAAVVLAKGTSAKQVESIRSNVLRLAGLAGWKRLGDLSASSCLEALARLRDTPGAGTSKARGGRSAQTRNHYLRHAKQFVAWCVEDGRLARNPLAAVKPVGVEADRRHDRRNPSDAEVAALLTHLAGPDARGRCGMTGPQRSLGYRLCMATGFRASELRSLGPGSFDLAAGTVAVRAAYDKRKRPCLKRLPPWLVSELAGWLAGGGGLWGTFPEVHPGRLLKADLAAAGVPYSVEGPDGPLFFDFHALRVWYVTWVAHRPGISPKVLMEEARHSDPRLTLKVYAKARGEESRKLADDMPVIGLPPPS